MKYTIYKITNKVNGKIYIGKHQTNNINDGYMGSGKLLKKAIIKYGAENFAKEILHVFNTEEEMNAKEAELVTEDFCVRDDNYNLCVGGHGGFGYINSNPEKFLTEKKLNILRENGRTEKHRKRASKQLFDLTQSKEWHKDRVDKIYDRYGSDGFASFKGKSHTKETKEKISETMKGLGCGSKNSQYNTMWITNGTDNRKIKKDIDLIPEGWYKGRSNNKRIQYA